MNARLVLEKVANMLSSRYGINVVMDGTSAKTDGKTIYIPSVSEKASDKVVDTLIGYIYHEAGHILYTDFRVSRDTEELIIVSNCLEDARIETSMEKLYPGANRFLVRLFKNSEEYVERVWPKLPMLVKASLLTYIRIRYGKSCLLYTILTLRGTKAKRAELERVLGIFWRIAEKRGVRNAPNTQHICDTAQMILDELKLEPSATQPNPQPGNPDGAEEGEEGELEIGDGWDLFDGEEDGEEGALDETFQDKGAEASASGDGEKKEETSRPKSRTRMGSDMDRAQIHRHGIINMDHEDVVMGTEYTVFTTRNDKVNLPRGDHPLKTAYRTSPWGLTLPDEARGGEALRQALLGVRKSYRVGGQRRGAINGGSLYKLASKTGDRIFSKRIEQREKNSRVSILIDNSGSMCESKKVSYTQSSVLAISRVMESAGIPYEVLTFHTETKNEAKSGYVRSSDAIIINVLKCFGHRRPVLVDGLRHLAPTGCNRDGESVAIAAKRLKMAARKDERLILIVVSDGQPNHGERHGDTKLKNRIDQQHLRDVVTSEISGGMEIYAVGLCTDSVKRYYPEGRYVVCEDERDLSGGLMQTLRKAILAGGVKRGVK
jgi:hypothetical protein